jgi:[ribosomal protein S5]-alanine N-acetyltransferase
MTTPTIEHVETSRLVLERLRDDHGEELFKLLLDPRVGRTLWPGQGPPTELDALAGLASKIEHWERYGFGLWLARDRATGEMVGRGGLQHTYVSYLAAVEAAWAILPERWGEGLGTELAGAAVEAGLGELRLPEIVAFTLPDNIASRRVMEKTGFRYDCEIVHAGLPHVLYRNRAEWT